MIHKHNIANICAEVYDCLNLLGKAYIEKLPDKLYNAIEEKKDLNYVSKYNSDKGITEDTFSEETFNIIAALDLKYWCTESEKEEKINLYKNNEKEFLEKAREIYNVDNIFKNKAKNQPKEENIEIKNFQIVVRKKKLFENIYGFIKRIFIKN